MEWLLPDWTAQLSVQLLLKDATLGYNMLVKAMFASSVRCAWHRNFQLSHDYHILPNICFLSLHRPFLLQQRPKLARGGYDANHEIAS
ncbi:hypothetical protein V6N13_010763 [Hibiscus sabdariffa]